MPTAEEKATLLLVRGAVASEPQEAQDTIRACAEEIRGMLRKHGACGVLAFALVGAEIQAEEISLD